MAAGGDDQPIRKRRGLVPIRCYRRAGVHRCRLLAVFLSGCRGPSGGPGPGSGPYRVSATVPVARTRAGLWWTWNRTVDVTNGDEKTASVIDGATRNCYCQLPRREGPIGVAADLGTDTAGTATNEREQNRRL